MEPSSPERTLVLPDPCVVVLIGASGSGKSTFARKHFRPTEVLSSDVCRGLVSDDDNDQSATRPAFALLHFLLDLRLARRRLCVVDATNVRREDRAPILAIAQRHGVPYVAVVLDLPSALSHTRNAQRPDRAFGPEVVEAQRALLARDLASLGEDGYAWVARVDSEAAVDALRVSRSVAGAVPPPAPHRD